MNASLLKSQAYAYLTHQMSAEERAAFEDLLHTDPTARNFYLRFTLQEEGAQILQAEEELRAYALSLREQNGPLPEPRLTWLDRLRIAWYARPFQTGLSALLVTMCATLLTLFTWANLSPMRDTSSVVAAAYKFMEPPHGTIAGGPESKKALSKRDIFEKAAGHYWNTRAGAADSLLTLSKQQEGFNFADYYLAHWLLRAGQWSAAKAGLEQCLTHRNYFLDLDDTRETEPTHLRMNLLLARLGETGHYEDIREDLEQLEASLPPTEQTVRQASALVRHEMGNPLRKLRIR